MKEYTITLTEREISLIGFALENLAIEAKEMPDTELNLAVNNSSDNILIHDWVAGISLSEISNQLGDKISQQTGIEKIII